MNSERADRWCERGILGFVLAIVIFGPLATGAVRMLEFLVIQGLALGVLLLWGVRIWLAPRFRFFWPPVCWVVAAFVVYAVVRYCMADIEYVARVELLRVLVYATVFFAVLNNLHKQEHVKIIVLALVFLGMAVASYAVYQFLTGSNQVWHFTTPYVKRGTGTYINPNHLAGLLEMLLPLGLAYTLAGRLGPVMKVFVGYASLVILAGIAVTVSRGSWIATAFALVIFFCLLLFQRQYWIQSALMLMVLAGGIVWFVTHTDISKERFDRMMVSGKPGDTRFELWRPAYEMWRDHRWWGVGPGHYDYRFEQYRPQTVQLRPDRVHNDYLNTLADWGLAGALLVAGALGLMYAGAIKTWRFVRGTANDFVSKKTNKFSFVLGASVAWLALLGHSMTDFNMHIPANAIIAVTLMALLVAHLRFATDRYWISAGAGWKALVTIVLLAALGYLGYQEMRRGREYAWLNRASRLPVGSPEEIAALEKAYAAEPKNFETTTKIGERYWFQSSEGALDSEELAEKALVWFKRSMELQPYDSFSPLRYGMCLDWVGRTGESLPYFERAVQLDPNGFFPAAHMGWHYVQVGQWASARPWFERSRRLEWENNLIADTYLALATERLEEAASADYQDELRLRLRQLLEQPPADAPQNDTGKEH